MNSELLLLSISPHIPYSTAWIEDDKLDSLALSEGFGIAVFSPLYQGFLTSKYLKGIPADSRVGRGETWIGNELNDKMIEKLNKLNDIATSRGQTLSQMALSWVLHNKAVTTVLIGASRPEQITENIGCLDRLDFTEDELAEIDRLAERCNKEAVRVTALTAFLCVIIANVIVKHICRKLKRIIFKLGRVGKYSVSVLLPKLL